MSIKASEISDLIKARIDKFQSATEARNVGTVVDRKSTRLNSSHRR